MAISTPSLTSNETTNPYIIGFLIFPASSRQLTFISNASPSTNGSALSPSKTSCCTVPAQEQGIIIEVDLTLFIPSILMCYFYRSSRPMLESTRNNSFHSCIWLFQNILAKNCYSKFFHLSKTGTKQPFSQC